MYEDMIRDAINEELNRRGLSRYHLAVHFESAGICSRSTVYKWLRGANDTTTSIASECMSYLDLRVARARTRTLQAQ